MPADLEELEPVPTMQELFAKGLAKVTGWTQAKKPAPTHYTATAEGQQLIYGAMTRNAERFHRNEQAKRLRTNPTESPEEAEA